MTVPAFGENEGQGFRDDTSAEAVEPMDATEEPEPLGPLLDEPDGKKVKAAVLKNWKDQTRGLSYQLCQVEQAECWRGGERWVYIRPGDDDRSHAIWRPPGIDRLPPMPDKVDQLMRRLVAQLLVDEPILEGEPINGDREAKQSTELVSRIFEVEGGSEGWNLPQVLAAAIDIATTQKSAFAHIWMNPVGGGYQPVTVLADANAVQYDPSNPEGCLMVPDAQTGVPVLSQNRVTKYLSPDNTLTPSETADTVRRWVPWPEITVLGFRNVRFLPEWCDGAHDADGMLVVDYRTIGELKQRYPDTVGKMTDAELTKLRQWQPIPVTDLLPAFARDPKKIGTQVSDGKVPDDAVALVMWEYHRQSPVYPKGAAICISGADEPIGSDTLEVPVEQPDGTTLPKVLQVPVAQCRCINDPVGRNPYGQALVTKIGPWSELMGQQWAAMMDWLDRWNHPMQFLPIGSIVQPGALANRSGEPVYFNAQGQPFTEPVPAIPSDVKEWYDRAGIGMDKEALLSESAQGLEAPNVNSGKQAAITINQALVALSPLQSNATDFFTHTGTLLLERLQAYVTVPQAVAYVGDDGSYKADEWRGPDLTGTKAMRIARGSFTMLHPDAKKASLLTDVQAGILPLEDAVEMIQDGTRSALGMDDDPVLLRINRQIAAAMKGNAAVFTQTLPVDTVPAVAHKRFRKLAQVTMESDFAGQPPEVQKAVLDACEAMRQAAGIQTVAEQAQAAQASAQAQQQAEAAKAQMDTQGKTQTNVATEQAKTAGNIQEAQASAEIELKKEAVRESRIRPMLAVATP